MGLLSRIKAVVLFGCIFFSCQSFAQDFFWVYNYDLNRPHSSTPLGACPAGASDKVFHGGGLAWACAHKNTDAKGNVSYELWGNVGRFGDACPANTMPFDEKVGFCPPIVKVYNPGDKCDDQTGGTSSNPMIWDSTSNKCTKFLDAKGDAPCAYIKGIGGGPTAYTVAGNLDSGGNAVAPPSFADDSISCTVQTISTSECTLNVAGAISCNVTGLLTGKANSGGTIDAADALCPNGKCPAKEPKTESKEDGCTPVGNGSGGTTCTQTKETTKDGTQQCGTVNGAYKCVTKPPFSNAVKTTITATSETLSDGSVKVTTVKDSANTVCTDVKSCTTQTSTTVSHNTTKPSGATSGGSSCTGVCNSNGGGVETNPSAGTGNSGTGNGTPGNGDGNGDGEGGDGTASTTDDCKAPPDCDGDPFQCAILKQAHIDTCKIMAAPTAAEIADTDAKAASEVAKVASNQAAMDTQVNTLLSGFQGSTGGSGTGGGKCLPDVPFSVMGHGMKIEFSKACDSISFIRMAILAMAYLFAARIVFREV